MRHQSAPESSRLPRPARRVRRGALAIGLLVTVAACGNGHKAAPATSTPSTTATSSTASVSPTRTSPSATGTTTASHVPPASTSAKPTASVASCVDRTARAMTTAQRVGQLFMTGVSSSGMTTAEATAVTQGKVGSAFLKGRTNGGTAAVKSLTDRVRSLGPTVRGARLGMFVSTDQEGGQVQVLNGPGFSTIPSAVTQGRSSAVTLQSNAVVWGRQLLSAGVNMNLAPVADTVPPGLVTVNAPIGKFDREYGNDPTAVAVHSTAFMRGMRQAGVDPTIKHFPGLGRVIGNTDVTANVVDGVTTATDPYLQPFRSGIQAGTPFVMVSSAIYSRVDPRNQAAFSSAVIRGCCGGRSASGAWSSPTTSGRPPRSPTAPPRSAPSTSSPRAATSCSPSCRATSPR